MSVLEELRELIFAIHADDALFINDQAELDPLGVDYIPEARVTAAIDAIQAAHSRPRIKVKHGATFIVDLAHGIASDAFTVGPVDVFRGKGAREVVAEAAKSEDGFAAIGVHDAWKEPGVGFLNDFIGKALAKADLAPVAETVRRCDFMDVVGEGGVRLRFSAAFWTALTAISDGVLVDVDWHRPAMFLKDDTVIGLLMGIAERSAMTP